MGEHLKILNTKACHLVPTTQVVYMHMVIGSMWTFVYKDVHVDLHMCGSQTD